MVAADHQIFTPMSQKKLSLERSHLTGWILVLFSGVVLRKQTWTINRILFEDISVSIPKARKDLHRQLRGVHSSASGSSIDARQILRIVQKPTESQRERAVRRVREGCDSDGSKWLTPSMVGLCGGSSLPLAQRARPNGRWQDSI